VANTGRYTTLAQRGFQRDLGSKAGTVHRQYISRRGDEVFGEKLDSRSYATRQLGAGKMQATYNLYEMRSGLVEAE
jgi:hypothetical protein